MNVLYDTRHLENKSMKRWEDRSSIVLSNQGMKIFGIIHRPLGLDNYPVVLVCHGLGGNKTGKYRLYVHLAEMLTQAGIACLRVDFRGSGDSEGAFSDMTIDSEISDALLALDYLKNDPNVDAERIGIFGRSFGGVVAVSAASLFQKAKSLALWAPVFNGDQWRAKWELLQKGFVDTSSAKEYMRINGQLPGMPFYQQLFGLTLQQSLNSLKKLPLLHIHGELDDLVNTTHADGYMAARSTSEAQSRFIRLEKSDHDFSDPEEQKRALDETVLWFQSTL